MDAPRLDSLTILAMSFASMSFASISLPRLAGLALLASGFSSGLAAAPAAAEGRLVRDYMATVENNFGPMGAGVAEPYADAQFGTLPTDLEAQQSISLQPGSYILVGVCDTNCDDLAVSIYSSSLDFYTVYDEEEVTNQPMLFFDIDAAGTYTATVSMQDCNVDDCDYGFNILRAFD